MAGSPWTAEGAIYYVDKNSSAANDSGPGTTTAPLKSIDAGMNRVQAGDTLWVRGSTDPNSSKAIYDRTLKAGLPIVRPGRFGAPIKVSVAPGHTVILRGSGSRNGIELDKASYYIIDGFKFRNYQKATEGWATKSNIVIQNCEFTQTYEAGLLLRNITNMTVSNCYVHHCYEAGISLRASSNVVFDHCVSSFNNDYRGVDGDGDGFHVLASKNVSFINCTAQANSEDGFDVTADAKLVNCLSYNHPACNVKLWRRVEENYTPHRYDLMNCVIYGAGEAGIKASRGAEVHINNCVVHGNKEEGIKFHDPNYGLAKGTISGLIRSEVNNCIVSRNGYQGVMVNGTYMNNVTCRNNNYYLNHNQSAGYSSNINAIYTDPKYVSSTNFRLQTGSPSINSGDALCLPPDMADINRNGNKTERLPLDLDSHARILSGRVDRGAYER